MNSPKQAKAFVSKLKSRLRSRWFPVVALGSAIALGGPVLFVRAQEVNRIFNTGTGNFRATENGPLQPQPVLSNRVSFPARPSVAGIELIKVGDRASAEPGDTVVYRLLIRNTGETPLSNLVITDVIPFGTRFLRETVSASIGDAPVALDTPVVDGRNVRFSPTAFTLGPKQTLSVNYAVVLTPDAIRGNGRNLAVATATDGTGRQVRSSTASHRVRIQRGILTDCGTILGRVFEDRNFDGEQQPGEPGIPNAVIFMDDGNRVITDANGLFSVANVINGYRTGTLDLTSLPGYTAAPNLYRIEGNSVSRLVRLAPGSTGRMNFAVTPTFREQGANGSLGPVPTQTPVPVVPGTRIAPPPASPAPVPPFVPEPVSPSPAPSPVPALY